MGKKAKQAELPGLEQRDVPEIEQAAEHYRRIRDERCELSKQEAEAKSALIQVMKNLGRSFYQYNGLKVQLEITDNVKVKSSDSGDEEPIGTFRQPATRKSKRQQQGSEQVDEAERERLHREAVANWRRERPASTEEEEDIDREATAGMGSRAFRQEEPAGEAEDGGMPFPTEYPQAEINRMAEFCAADRIGDKKKSVKICYVDGQPHAITGAVWKSANCMQVNAWPILPLANVGEENAKTYDQAQEEYNRQFDEPDHYYRPLSYQNIKINCGSVKKPDWWVMVGPEIVFRVNYSAAYPDDEIEAMQEEFGVCDECGVENGHEESCSRRSALEAEDSFTAERCDECGRIDGAHTRECWRSNALTFDDYLMYAEAHYKRNHQSYARKMELRRDREMDAKVKEWIHQKVVEENEAEEAEAGTGEMEGVESHWTSAPISDENEKAEMRKDRAKREKKAKRAKLSSVEAAIDR